MKDIGIAKYFMKAKCDIRSCVSAVLDKNSTKGLVTLPTALSSVVS